MSDKDIIWPIMALAAAVVALGVSIYSSPLVMGVAIPTLLVSIAVVRQYLERIKIREEDIPLEDFSWWADVGEPAGTLLSLKPGEEVMATQVVASDFKNLSRNADLLSSRLRLLVGRREFINFSPDFTNDSWKVAHSLADLARSIETSGMIESELYKTIEQHAARFDRMANKLFEYEKDKSETIHIYIDPLRRASEKLSRDLRKAASNLYKFEKRKSP